MRVAVLGVMFDCERVAGGSGRAGCVQHGTHVNDSCITSASLFSRYRNPPRPPAMTIPKPFYTQKKPIIVESTQRIF